MYQNPLVVASFSWLPEYFPSRTLYYLGSNEYSTQWPWQSSSHQCFNSLQTRGFCFHCNASWKPLKWPAALARWKLLNLGIILLNSAILSLRRCWHLHRRRLDGTFAVSRQIGNCAILCKLLSSQWLHAAENAECIIGKLGVDIKDTPAHVQPALDVRQQQQHLREL